MKKAMKKVTSVALAATMMCGCVAGCGGSSSAGSSGDEPITLTVFSELANYSGEQVGWSADILLEEFNVVLKNVF